MIKSAMPSARIRIPISKEDLMYNGGEVEFVDQPVSSLSDMVFRFLEDGDQWSSASSSSSGDYNKDEALLEQNDEDEDRNGGVVEDKSFWENQHNLLHAALCKTSSLESRLRNITKEALREIQAAGTICGCGRQMVGDCRNCLMREISGRLRNAGYYNSAVCKSKWRNSPDIPSGEHSFLDVIDNSSPKRGQVRVIIELNFRGEFEMAKASEEYNRLVGRLPEVFVGKVERLSNVIKILCLAGKKCMQAKKMHLGPWRRHRYMQAKWLGSCERSTSMPELPVGYSARLRPKPKASMLTMDLQLETMPNMHCTAVAVV